MDMLVSFALSNDLGFLKDNSFRAGEQADNDVLRSWYLHTVRRHTSKQRSLGAQVSTRVLPESRVQAYQSQKTTPCRSATRRFPRKRSGLFEWCS